MTKRQTRNKKISIRVNDEEFDKIQNKALLFGVKPTVFLRNLSLNYPLSNRVDTLAFLELQKVRGDLGRIGGLLRMILNDKNKYNLNSDIDELIEKLKETQKEVGDCAKKLSELEAV